MALFEVFIPARPGTTNESLMVEIEASSWLLALRTGMQQIGEQGESLASIMCENRPDGTIVVKDPVSRRMFRIRPLQEKPGTGPSAKEIKAQERAEADETTRLRAEAEQAEAARAQAERVLREKVAREKETAERARRKQEADDAERRRREAEQAAKAALERAAAEKALREQERIFREAQKKAAASAEGKSREIRITRSVMTAEDIASAIKPSEEAKDTFDLSAVLADLFIDTMAMVGMDEATAADFVLDQALKTIRAEAASVILSDVNSALNDLYFAAARGKVAEKLKDIRIPRGKGIVGFSVEIACPVTVSDAKANPNFYRQVSERTGYETRSILSVPIQYEDRTYGAIELVNKIGSDRWTAGELNVVQLLAQKLGEVLNAQHDRIALS